MSRSELIVLKFGSSVLRSEADLPKAASEIARHVSSGARVVAVVSAIGDGTEKLLQQALATGHDPQQAEACSDAALAALLATGEASAAALLGLTLDRLGIACSVLDAGRVGPFTRGPQLDAEPHAFDAGTVKRALQQRPVAILPGFVGRDGDGHFSLLGRGGSDLSALFVADALNADRCCLLKDVDGIYDGDPARSGPRPRRYESLHWEETLRLNDCILQQKASQFAFRHRVPFEVGACGQTIGTRVGDIETRIAGTPPRTGVGRLAS